MIKRCEISELIGKKLVYVKVNEEKDAITFECESGERYEMFHEQDCCESVYIDDICGNIENLIGETIVMAEESTNLDKAPKDSFSESYTWTFYKLATIKGYVTLRWYGESNGYYSESVSFMKRDIK